MRKIDLVGQRFKRLLVLKESSPSADGRIFWLCECDCGARSVVSTCSLRSGRTGSCGCRKLETAKENALLWQIRPRHGMTGTPEHKTWMSMLERCAPGYRFPKHYYDRGIRVCERWHVFENFIEDMGLRPSRAHSLDRIDVDGNYEPGNCRWALQKMQQRNKQRTRYLRVDGVSRPLMDVADELGIKKSAAQYFFSTFKKLRERYSQIEIKDG